MTARYGTVRPGMRRQSNSVPSAAPRLAQHHYLLARAFQIM